MRHMGFGVMLGYLGGNEETVAAMKDATGKVIADLRLEDNELLIKFDDGTGIAIYDDGQSCSEYRHMSTDDNLADYVGAQLLGAEIKDAPTEEDEYGDHEVQFLEVMTSKGVFTMVNHNEHNGYYGGFWIVVKPFGEQGEGENV